MKNTTKSTSHGRTKRSGSGGGPQNPILLPAELCLRIDHWARSQADRPSRSEAVRHLLERALADEKDKLGKASISVSDLNASNDD